MKEDVCGIKSSDINSYPRSRVPPCMRFGVSSTLCNVDWLLSQQLRSTTFVLYQRSRVWLRRDSPQELMISGLRYCSRTSSRLRAIPSATTPSTTVQNTSRSAHISALYLAPDCYSSKHCGCLACLRQGVSCQLLRCAQAALSRMQSLG